MQTAIEFRDVDILFAREGGRRGRQAVQQALASLDAGATRADIAQRHGVVLGVAGASLAVERGQICVLMGLSGSGKSTLLRAANRLNAVTRGQVLVDDGGAVVDVASCGAAQLRAIRRRRIAMVFQQFGLLPWRTVRDNVGLGLELRGDDPRRRAEVVAEKLELVGLTDWATRYVGELSGGMQQRVGLARAFATDADILLMDEPFSALDPLIRARLQDELLSLQARVRKTILFVSHDLDEALRIGNRICILDGGRILQVGSVRDIVLEPAHARVAEFVRHMNPLNVLSGAMVMERRMDLPGADGMLRLDAAGRYLARPADPGPPALSLMGQAVANPPWASAGTRLQELIELCAASGHPVLLHEDGHWCGVCGEREILRALAAARGGKSMPHTDQSAPAAG